MNICICLFYNVSHCSGQWETTIQLNFKLDDGAFKACWCRPTLPQF